MTGDVTITSVNSSPPIGALIGGVVGGIIVTGVLLFGVVICFVMVVKKQNRSKYTFDTPVTNDPSMTLNVVYNSKILA